MKNKKSKKSFLSAFSVFFSEIAVNSSEYRRDSDIFVKHK